MVTAALLWSIGWLEPANPELRAYVSRPGDSLSWAEKTVQGHRTLDLISQTWQGQKWRHDLVVVEHRHESPPSDTMIIEVTGWAPNKTDLDDALMLADLAVMPVAVLFQVPSQPLWGHEEDDLIAHTFEKFIETGDPEWLLLFPMVKSVKAAMDAIEQATGIKKFVITGASKRGWTTWLVGALGDKRVVGIAPRVFDNLDFPKQLAQQKAYWGSYSPMIGDYTERGLQDLLGTDQGKRLIQLVDPMATLRSIKTPVLSITGTNDAYWTVDSSLLYWEQVGPPKWALAVPGSGHVLTDKPWWLNSLGSFAQECSSGTIRSRYTVSTESMGDTWALHVKCTGSLRAYRVWQATSTDLHFDDKTWEAGERVAVDGSGPTVVSVTRSRGRLNTALLVDLEFVDGLRLTTPVHLVRKK